MLETMDACKGLSATNFLKLCNIWFKKICLPSYSMVNYVMLNLHCKVAGYKKQNSNCN